MAAVVVVIFKIAALLVGWNLRKPNIWWGASLSLKPAASWADEIRGKLNYAAIHSGHFLLQVAKDKPQKGMIKLQMD